MIGERRNWMILIYSIKEVFYYFNDFILLRSISTSSVRIKNKYKKPTARHLLNDIGLLYSTIPKFFVNLLLLLFAYIYIFQYNFLLKRFYKKFTEYLLLTS
jgi:hypothetical protein